MSRGQDATIIGAVIGLTVAVAPKVYEKITGRRHEEADTASIVAGGAGSVTAAALALLEEGTAERARSREAEAKCQIALEKANARIDHLEARLDAKP